MDLNICFVKKGGRGKCLAGFSVITLVLGRLKGMSIWVETSI